MKFDNQYKGKENCDVCGAKSDCKLEHDGRALFFCKKHSEFVGKFMIANPQNISEGNLVDDEFLKFETESGGKKYHCVAGGIEEDNAPVIYIKETNKSFTLSWEELLDIARIHKIFEK